MWLELVEGVARGAGALLLGRRLGCVARQLRHEYPGAVYHVTSRGNARGAVFLDEGDRGGFLELLARVGASCAWVCHAYCLMGNHYHLVLETPRPNLSLGMRRLNSAYAQSFNARHGRVGHVFQGRYKAILLEKEAHLLEVCRYVVLNPVRARLVAGAAEWRWSSFRATAGQAPPPPSLRSPGCSRTSARSSGLPAEATVPSSPPVWVGNRGRRCARRRIWAARRFCATSRSRRGRWRRCRGPTGTRSGRRSPTSFAPTVARRLSSPTRARLPPA